jgi:hypothetical protein
MGKTQKIKRFRLPFSPSLTLLEPNLTSLRGGTVRLSRPRKIPKKSGKIPKMPLMAQNGASRMTRPLEALLAARAKTIF